MSWSTKELNLEKLYKLAKKIGGANDEGEARVELTVVDRNTHRRLHYLPVPYDFILNEHLPQKDRIDIEDEKLRRALFIAYTNLSIAQGEFNGLFRILQDRYYQRVQNSLKVLNKENG